MKESEALLKSQDHCSRGMEVQGTEQKPEKAFTCLECGKAFKRKDHWKNHLKTHTQERSFSCGVCGNAFRLKAHLDRHMIRHTKEKTCVCYTCGKAFGHKSILNIHMRVHSKEKPYTCSICGRRFSQQGAMKTHERIHSEERLYSCYECKLSFKQKSCLSKHMWVHSDKRPFPCVVCDKRFRNRTTLNVHMQVHSKVKPFSCSVCGNSFSVKCNLIIHERKHRQEKPFTCEECGKSFDRKDTLKTHVRLHVNQKLFCCKKCKICFRIKSSLERHNRQFHSLDGNSLSDRSNSLINNNSDNISKNSDGSMHSTNTLIPQKSLSVGYLISESDHFTVERTVCNHDFLIKTESSSDDSVIVKEESHDFESEYKSIQSSSSPLNAVEPSENQNFKTGDEKCEFNINKPFPEHCDILNKECKKNVEDTISRCNLSSDKHSGNLNHIGSETMQCILPVGKIEEQETSHILSTNEHSDKTQSFSMAVWTGIV